MFIGMENPVGPMSTAGLKSYKCATAPTGGAFMLKSFRGLVVIFGVALATSGAIAQSPAPPAVAPVNPAAQMSPLEYGAMISNANAKKVAAAALAEAQKMNGAHGRCNHRHVG